MNYKAVEDKLAQTAEIRVRGILKKRKEGLKEFIVRFFTEWNNENETIYTVANRKVCEPKCRRSLGDVYKICKYYYPKCTLKQVALILYIDCFDEIERFRSSFCSATKKRMFYVGDDDQDSEMLNKYIKDEFGFTYKEWTGQEDDEDAEDMDDDNVDWNE